MDYGVDIPWPGGNKAPTYQPSKICNGLSDVPGHYNGGFGAPRNFRVENFGHGGSAISEAVPTYARASPLLDEVEGAQSFGMNVFRLPFRIGRVCTRENFLMHSNESRN